MRKRWALVLVPPMAYWLWPTPPLGTIHFLDVGQGDAALVQSGQIQVLIDGGPDDQVLAGIGKAMPAWDRTIETVILSHPHADHYRGLKGVLERYRVGTLWVSGVRQDAPEYQELERLARRRGVRIATPEPGERIVVPNGWVRVLQANFARQEIANLNNASLVVSVQLGGVSALFPGDAEEAEERESASVAGIRSDVLKVPHHGSRTSTTPGFLQAVQPRQAVISAGEGNRYGHPARQTLDRLRDQGVRTYRTDQEGTVTVTVTAKGWHLKPAR